MFSKKTTTHPYDHIVFVFQGGGALGAYYVGIVEALQEADYLPEWVIGTSMGAINAAIIAGNQIKDRLPKLKEFWEIISYPLSLAWPYIDSNIPLKQLHHFWHSQIAVFFGQPGFFIPRFPNPILNPFDQTPDKLGFYDTSPLYHTLKKLIDFDLINRKKIRLTLGAVEVCDGKQNYFDNTKQEIGPEHIMASAALPPGFPAIEIADKYYWDGALSSNTPVSQVFAEQDYKKCLCFMMHVFDSFGLSPKNIDDVLKRKKDIDFASQYLNFITLERKDHSLRCNIYDLIKMLPIEKRKTPQVKRFLKKARHRSLAIVRFLRQGKVTDLSSKDYEFSRHSIHEHMDQGYGDARRALELRPWLTPIPKDMGVILHDMTKL